MNDIKTKITQTIQKRHGIRAFEIATVLGFSRQYVHKFLQELKEEGKIVLIGKTNRAKYVIADHELVADVKRMITDLRRVFINRDISEDIILDLIKRETGIFLDIPENVARIVEYAFVEMTNNAIEHSQSASVEVWFKRVREHIRFDVIDHGVGIFYHLMQKKGLKNELEAVQDLLKGKQTTDPERHTGEGIFFTSKVADALTIKSFRKKITFNNLINDIFIQDISNKDGTRVTFVISTNSQKKLEDTFSEYSSNSYEFDKTIVTVRFYKMGSIYISRSQARRIMTGLEKFRSIVLDFDQIKTIGQAFADEIFRVWQHHHPDIRITHEHSNENIEFMIKRAMIV